MIIMISRLINNNFTNVSLQIICNSIKYCVYLYL